MTPESQADPNETSLWRGEASGLLDMCVCLTVAVVGGSTGQDAIVLLESMTCDSLSPPSPYVF